MDDFEILLRGCMSFIERFVKYRLPSAFDADDVLQEVYLAAYEGFGRLSDKSNFKSWLIGIARNKCNDYYRKQAKTSETPLDEISESVFCCSRIGLTETNHVRDTMENLAAKDREILHLYFFCDMPQSEIAARLGIPVGTVKSRLHTAKTNFKKQYPYPPKPKGEKVMGKMPKFMPEYKIEKSDKAPFPVIWEELMGWFIVPRLGEKLAWGSYDMPSGELVESNEMQVVGKAEIHGIEGVEITVDTNNPMECNSEGGNTEVSRKFVAQLTDTHCRYLAESHMRDGIHRLYTFLDGDSFIDNWGFGENNCGNETHIKPKGVIIREGDIVTAPSKPFLLDIVGRYTVTIGGRAYDTVCVMDIETYNFGVVSEQYLDRNGRTVLWRRFNADDWAFDRYKQKWSEKLPDNERLTVNGETYVHWYDCITDYVL